MKQRLTFLSSLYVLLLAAFAVQKPVFLFVNAPAESSYGVADALNVMLNALLLDVPVTGYFFALPLLAVAVSCLATVPVRLRRWLSAYYAVAAFAVSLAFVADLSLYPFWKFKLDAMIFNYIDSPRGAAASVSAGYIACRAVAVAAIAWGLYACLRRVTPAVLRPIAGDKARAAAAAVTLLIAGPLAVSIRGGLSESTANIGKVYYSEDEYLNHSAVNPMFSLLYSLGKTENYADEFNYLDEPERARIFGGLYPDTAADTTRLLTTTRPNIVIILLESFGGQTVAASGGRADITPCYNRLAGEGIFFDRCYSNSFRTDRGVLSALSGYPAPPTVSLMKMPVKSRTLPCIARTLTGEGYACSFLYGGDINFTNMQSYLRTGGYSTIIKDDDFTADERKDNPWGANDDVTFDRLCTMIASQKHVPWHIGFLTLSSHEPFEVPYSRLKEKIPNAFAFTDACLGRFVDRIRKTDAWRDLLIVCIPDHGYIYPEGITHEQHHRNTMLWIGGAVKAPRRVSTIMNQSDLAATLLGQLRIAHGGYSLSRDVFSPAYTYPFAFFSRTGYIGFADSTGHTVYDINAGRAIEDTRDGNDGSRTEKAKAIVQTLYDDIGNR